MARWLRTHLPVLPVRVPRVPVLVCALSSDGGQLPGAPELLSSQIFHSERSHVPQLRPKAAKTNKIKAKKKRKRAKYMNQSFTEEDIQMAKKNIKACEKMFSVISRQVNAKENHNAVSLHTYQKGRVK